MQYYRMITTILRTEWKFNRHELEQLGYIVGFTSIITLNRDRLTYSAFVFLYDGFLSSFISLQS